MCQDHQFWLNWWVNFAVAFGTIGAVVFALFGDFIKARRFPPKLRLRLKNRKGEKTPVYYTEKDAMGKEIQRTDDARYYHLVVSNEARWSKSTETEVLLKKIEECVHNKGYQTTWSGEVPLEWTRSILYGRGRTVGSAKSCDLCSVGKKIWFRIQVLNPPGSLKYLYTKKTSLILTIQAQGVESDSPDTKFKIEWDGLWDDDDDKMLHHLIVKELID